MYTNNAWRYIHVHIYTVHIQLAESGDDDASSTMSSPKKCSTSPKEVFTSKTISQIFICRFVYTGLSLE